MGVVRPITVSDLGEAIRNSDGKAAAGPDGRRLVDIKKCQREVVKHFNLWLLAGRVPAELTEGITTLIPKIVGTTDPACHRPITVSSWLLRLLHKVLAGRLDSLCPHSVRQKGFARGDGILENVQILRSLIERATKAKSPKPLALAFLDVRKAFDSVSHRSLLLACRRSGMPEVLISYVKHLYEESNTRLCYRGQLSDRIRVLQGVRQGDPLSGWIFNAVIDWALEDLDSDLGWGPEEARVNHAAFADDLALADESPDGLQILVTQVVNALGKSGLKVNGQKCASLVVKVQGRKWFTYQRPCVSVNGTPIRALKIRETYRYLGVLHGDFGTQANVTDRLSTSISRLAKASLKPQQRYYAFRYHVVPALWHQLVLANVCKGELLKIDCINRKAMRSFLKLPHDVPNAFFHASVADGGLGIPSVYHTVARLKIDRNESLCASEDPLIRYLRREGFIASQLKIWKERLTKEVPRVSWSPPWTRVALDSFWAGKLYDTADGAGLRHSSLAQTVVWPQRKVGDRWLTSGTVGLTRGSKFVTMVGLRAGSLYTRVRASRGRENPARPPNCPSCWKQGEGGVATPYLDSLGHRLQTCAYTHGVMVERHDAVVKLMTTQLRRKGYDVWVEEKIPWRGTFLKPDIIVRKPREINHECITRAWVIDPSIVADNCPRLPDEFQKKVDKYQLPEVEQYVIGLTGAETSVSFAGAIWNWRGVMCSSSIQALLNVGLSKFDLECLCERVVNFGAKIYGVSCTNRVQAPRPRST